MTGRNAEGGYVLVAVLGVMVVLSGLVASSSLVAHSMLRSARTDAAHDRLDALLRGGLEITAYQLFALKVAPAEVDGREIRFGGGAITPRIADEAGRIDVNGADPAVLAGALRIAGLDTQTAKEVMSRIVALRGPPASPAAQAPTAPARPDTPVPAMRKGVVQPAPAAKPGETSGDNAVRPPDPVEAQARTGFRSVEEFLDFAKLDRTDAAALSGLLTVLNPDGRLNALAAGRRTLLALPDMSEPAADAFLAARRSALGPDPAALKSALDRQQKYVKFEGGPAFRVHLSARDAQGRQASREAVIAAGRGSGDPFYILSWE